MRPFYIIPIFLLLLTLGCKQTVLLSHRGEAKLYTATNSPIPSPDGKVDSLLKPYKVGVDTLIAGAIGYSDIPLTKAQPECTIGNFMADAVLAASQKIDSRTKATILNYGGIRLPYVAPGKLTRGTMIELMPFDNMIAIVEIPGTVLKEWCDNIAARKGWPVSGLSFTIKNGKAENIRLSGEPINSNILYTISTTDYLTRGGDNCEFLRTARVVTAKVSVRDAMITFVEQLTANGKALHPKIEKRISYAE